MDIVIIVTLSLVVLSTAIRARRNYLMEKTRKRMMKKRKEMDEEKASK